MQRLRSSVLVLYWPCSFSRQSARIWVPRPSMFWQVSANLEAPDTAMVNRGSRARHFMKNCIMGKSIRLLGLYRLLFRWWTIQSKEKAHIYNSQCEACRPAAGVPVVSLGDLLWHTTRNPDESYARHSKGPESSQCSLLRSVMQKTSFHRLRELISLCMDIWDGNMTWME